MRVLGSDKSEQGLLVSVVVLPRLEPMFLRNQ